ncbi:NAD/NADH kinase [Schizosaccharomyces japonicus yFS275]|uniref:NAD/NADH kinase n=1 Tax=Schizosaccharomyces japonicus (strain yFS275 / FY16936) TaxID=402676 RepID=B6JYC1_SCHJY|nr:NAD/NADH kinase [Schizosaccharomyces japonicus yFS275]EEB06539.1 NAD/NADH kinase [Schizosaccharomyces japonicus yFS275]
MSLDKGEGTVKTANLADEKNDVSGMDKPNANDKSLPRRMSGLSLSTLSTSPGIYRTGSSSSLMNKTTGNPRTGKSRWTRRNSRTEFDTRKRQIGRVKNVPIGSCLLHLSLENKQKDALLHQLSVEPSNKKDLTILGAKVKELSQLLSSTKLKFEFHEILFITNEGESAISAMVQLVRLLTQRTQPLSDVNEKSAPKFSIGAANGNHQQEKQETEEGKKPQSTCTIYLEKSLFMHPAITSLPHGRIQFWTQELCANNPNMFDCVITVGDDSTALRASWLFQEVVPPVISFSVAKHGFLTMFDAKDYMKVITRVFDSGFTVNLRMRFECTLMKYSADTNSHMQAGQWSVLNELVVDRGPNPFMTSLELFGDEEHITSVQADGLCISTPSGSTAYSLAAGGSLCHPGIPCVLISPICPHTLSFRPLVLPDSLILRILVPIDARSTAWCAFDGRNRTELSQGDYIQVSASPYPFPSVHTSKYTADWFYALRRSLNWNDRSKRQHDTHRTPSTVSTFSEVFKNGK